MSGTAARAARNASRDGRRGRPRGGGRRVVPPRRPLASRLPCGRGASGRTPRAPARARRSPAPRGARSASRSRRRRGSSSTIWSSAVERVRERGICDRRDLCEPRGGDRLQPLTGRSTRRRGTRGAERVVRRRQAAGESRAHGRLEEPSRPRRRRGRTPSPSSREREPVRHERRRVERPRRGEPRRLAHPRDHHRRIALVRVDDVDAAPVPALHIDDAPAVLVEPGDDEAAARPRRARDAVSSASCAPAASITTSNSRPRPRPFGATPPSARRTPRTTPRDAPAPTQAGRAAAPRNADADDRHRSPSRDRGARTTLTAQPRASPGNGTSSSSGGSATTCSALATSAFGEAVVGERRDAGRPSTSRRPQHLVAGRAGLQRDSRTTRGLPRAGAFDAHTPQPSTRTSTSPGPALGHRGVAPPSTRPRPGDDAPHASSSSATAIEPPPAALPDGGRLAVGEPARAALDPVRRPTRRPPAGARAEAPGVGRRTSAGRRRARRRSDASGRSPWSSLDQSSSSSRLSGVLRRRRRC